MKLAVFWCLVLLAALGRPCGGFDGYPRQHGVDVAHYVFRVTLGDESDEIAGETTVDVRLERAGLTQLVLDLASPLADGKGMTVSEVSNGGAPAKFTHEADRLTITLDAPSQAGDRRQFNVRYRGRPAAGLRIGNNKFSERTFFSHNWPNQAHQWLPTIDHPSDKATSEFIVTAPVKYQVVANGLLQSEVDLGDGTRCTHWKQSAPIATWLNALAVAQFAVHHAGTVRGVPLQTWVYHQELEAGIATFEEPARRAIEFYSDFIGPYPYEKLANIEAAGFSGGMEHATAIFYGERSVTMRPASALVAHEIAHQWFGDAVTESDWDDIWLSEGFATYFALLYAEHYDGRDAFVAGLKRSRDSILNLERRNPALAVVHNNLADMARVLDQVKYQKGAWTLHMLRGVMGLDKFQAGLREYYRRFRDGNVASADFQLVMQETSGQDLNWFFEQWLRRPGSPVVSGAWRYDAQAKRIEIELAQEQKSGSYRLPLEIGIETAGSTAKRVEKIELTQAKQKFSITAEREPTALTLDPNTWVLMTARFAQAAAPSDAAAANAAEPADVIFTGGNVYTVNDKQPRAEAIAARQGKIVFVGTSADAAAFRGDATRVIELGGKTVVPGLTDAHCHLAGVGEREMTLNLEGTTSLDDFLAKVKARVDAAKPGDWITGRGWIETFWKPQAFPTAADLDRISPNNPIWLTRADGHGAVANSMAMRLAGVTRDTPNPFGGEIMKDRASGEPNGMFLDNAEGLIARLIPRGNAQDRQKAVLLGAERSLSLGWTGLHVPSSSFRERDLLQRLYAENQLKLRVDLAILGPSEDARRLLREGPLVGAAEDRLSCRAIKVSFDGALGSKGAALLEKYADHDTAGFLKWKEEELLPMFEHALKSGVQLWTHAIGDRTNREILNLYEKALRNVPPAERKVAQPRWRVEHAQIVSLVDIPRFAALGVLPSMQPSHAIGDLHYAVSRLGLDRLDGAYAWQSFLRSGSIIAGGSDAPVERGEPMIEFYAAVARKDLKGYSGPGWHAEQAVSREDALRMFTIWAAQAAFHETTRGSLEPGKFADLTVLSQDILQIPTAEILNTRCLMTVIGGEVVYDAARAGR